MPPTKAEREAAQREEATLADGRFSAQENDNNSIAVSDDGYIGVSPEYKNYANETDKPLRSEDDDEADLEAAAAEAEANKARPVNPSNPSLTYDPGTSHPSEAVKPQDAYIEGNRALMERVVASAQAESAPKEGGDLTEGSDTPFSDAPPAEPAQ